ncbi:MAG: YajQ family cyclic di-GMP-binding protein [Elusimicrobia bacterium]|nr:YajQ family cyclic di-GMP-binding protein [Elusimicrobiota bacterium]
MAQEFSFDVVSKVNLQAVEDSVNMVMKEILNRFDFKGSIARVDLDKKTGEMTMAGEDEGRLRAVADILKTRLIKRGVSLKNFEFGVPEKAEGASLRQKVKITQGIATEKAKAMAQAVKASGRKATASIQGDHLRVSSKSKDELQAIMGMLKSANYDVELQFENYR